MRSARMCTRAGVGAHGHGNPTRPPNMVNLSKHDPEKPKFTLCSAPQNAHPQKIQTPKKERVYFAHLLPDPPVPRYPRPMDTLPLHHTKWSDRLAFDVALALEGSGETLDEIKQRHRITASELLVFNKDPVFLKKVEGYRDDIREKGVTFRLKARAQAEELLTTSWGLIHSPEVSPAVKADLIKSTVKWAGLEVKTDEGAGGAPGGVKININFGSNTPPMTLTADVEGDLIEHSDEV